MRRGRNRMRLGAFALLAALVLPGAGRADPVPPCVLGGPNGTWQVAKLEVPEGGAEISAMGWRQHDPAQVPFTDRHGYFTVLGYFIVDAAHTAVRWVVEMAGSGAPGAVVRVNGTTYYENPLFPTTRANGLQGGSPGGLVGGTLDPGTYYIVGFGEGASEGATKGIIGNADWSVSLSTGIACDLIQVPGEIVRYNQTDFGGGTHVYAAGLAGYGSGLSLRFTEARNTVLGSLYASVDRTVGYGRSPDTGILDLRYTTPTGSGQISTQPIRGQDPAVLNSTGGAYSFALDYYGTEPLVDITFLAVDLP